MNYLVSLQSTPRRRQTIAGALVCLIVASGGLLRSWDIGSWPVFIDEDMYTWGASTLTTMSLSEIIRSSYGGKSPLPLYLQGLVGLIAGDALVAGRMLAAFAGTASTVLCFFLGRRLGGSRVGLVTAALYALSPVAILHERMALLDGPMAACSLAAVLSSWNAIERRSWLWTGLALVCGIVAVQYKIPSIATALVPFLILWTYQESIKPRALFACIAAAGPVFSYMALMMSPIGAGLAAQNSGLQRAPSLAMLQSNVSTLLDSVGAYMPAGLGLFALAGAVLLFRGKARVALMFMTVIAAWSLPWLILSRFAPSRYYLPALPYAYALAAVALTQLPLAVARANRPAGAIAAGVSALVLAASGLAGGKMVTAHEIATLGELDNWQYRSGWPSGYGYAEAAQHIARHAEQGSSVAFAIDDRHRVGAGFLTPLPAGVVSLGLVTLDDTSPFVQRGGVYVIVDDDGDQTPGQRASSVLARHPHLRTVAHFRRPGAETGTYVLYGAAAP